MKMAIKQAQLAVAVSTALVATQAFAVDTSSSGLNSLQSWFMIWIPIACALIIIVLGLGLMAHMVKLHQLVYPVAGLIVIGSASALVGYFVT
ncbi:TrbC/VIRB2 family protein [Burkholderia sp. Ch1-1]|nr:TrbC/VIRB2 family protein [Burkholderia sp. Ch1-1]